MDALTHAHTYALTNTPPVYARTHTLAHTEALTHTRTYALTRTNVHMHACTLARASTHASMLLPKDLQCVGSLSLCALSILAAQMVAGGWSLSCWR